MRIHSINPNDKLIVFGQLYGMCDYISYTLSSLGYLVYKNTPIGSIDEVLPYLGRRANENQAIFKKARKDKSLMVKEMKRRLNFF
jgi:hypothetical protein